MLPYNDAGTRLFLTRATDMLARKTRLDPFALCKPGGVIRAMNQGFPVQIDRRWHDFARLRRQYGLCGRRAVRVAVLPGVRAGAAASCRERASPARGRSATRRTTRRRMPVPLSAWGALRLFSSQITSSHETVGCQRQVRR